jgi:hypothetical protein
MSREAIHSLIYRLNLLVRKKEQTSIMLTIGSRWWLWVGPLATGGWVPSVICSDPCPAYDGVPPAPVGCTNDADLMPDRGHVSTESHR